MEKKKDKIDLLGEEMRAGFKGVDSKFESMAQLINNGFNGLESRMDGMVTKEDFAVEVGHINQRLDNLEKEMQGMHQNFDLVFFELKEIRREIKEVDTRAEVLDLQIRMDKLEKKVKLK